MIPDPGSGLAIDVYFNRLIDLLPTFGIWFKQLVGLLVGLSLPASVVFFIGILYCVERLKQIRNLEKVKFEGIKTETAFEEDEVSGDVVLARRWDTVSRHIASENPNDWRSAILEADIMLDEMLSKLGYRGESVGEKLKRAVPGDFKSLNEAWEAHKVRNSIAHQGLDVQMTHSEANRVIQMYKKVFEEFYFI